MNWNPDRHERLEAPAWSSVRAREALSALIDDVEDAWSEEEGWPAHPRDGMGPSSGQYVGTAGVVTGLRRMDDWTGRTPRVALEEVVWHLQRGAATDERHPSLLIGRTGRALAVYREVPTAENATRVLRSIQDNDGSTEHELMWGLAGTLMAALWMHQVTRDDRFAVAGRRQVRRLWAAWKRSGGGPHTWVQALYGERQRYLGAAHGQVGNLHALWSVAEAWPDAVDGEELLARTLALARGTAVEGPDGTNWPATLGEEPELVQWCHGAPGVVAALSRVPAGLSEELDALLVRGAELVWNAGPLRKGPMLCHGTAGNGFALLKMWERTSDPLWLERARAFAMHAIGQRERIRGEFGRGWFSLWTGDVGVGVYLCACLEPSAAWDGWERF
jgi:lantibiotic modifying enzyme